MSKIVHRQPVWGWSVALLSTLLLSPVATATLLHALARTMPTPVANATAGSRNPAAPASSRRTTGDENALRRAVRDGAIHTLRLDGHAVAVVFAHQDVCLVPDDNETRVFFSAPAKGFSARSLSQTPPRAPPA